MSHPIKSILTAGRRILGQDDQNETSLPAAVPLLLVPVRLETRFVAGVADAAQAQQFDLAVIGRPSVGELLLRVYPDTIGTSSFEPELTSDELAAGTTYWQASWAAGQPVADDWKVLASRFGAPRGAWIATVLTPTNLGGTDAEPVFPSPATRASSYEKAPTAQGLPDHWTVVLDHAGTTRTVQGRPIQADLAVGFTPHDGTLPDGLSVDAGMRWLVDFAAAEQAGMAVRIPLSAAEQAGGFDRILVFGVRDAAADGNGQDELRALLDAHHYTDGLALVPQGAPTNNTSDADSAFSTADPDQAISFAVEAGADLAADASGDGANLARLLGLAPSTFSHVRHADGHGERNSADMLTALWPATFGYFLDQMMSAEISAEQQDAIRQFALATARPRGPAPALRVGAT
ncbi:MAG: hypothetical protein M3Y42_12240, partial [Actinomycetota bacterium]|nr:hypothetical protein [Actinomycetota bacterium]